VEALLAKSARRRLGRKTTLSIRQRIAAERDKAENTAKIKEASVRRGDSANSIKANE